MQKWTDMVRGWDCPRKESKPRERIRKTFSNHQSNQFQSNGDIVGGGGEVGRRLGSIDDHPRNESKTGKNHKKNSAG
jgi:hypothetical protein